MFYLDLDELDQMSQYSCLLGRRKGVLYNFVDEDHIDQGKGSVKANVLAYLETQGIAKQVGSIKLLTNVRTLGYIFNPVSFYFCFDAHAKPLCVVVEIGNTFKELKYFYLAPQTQSQHMYHSNQVKYYYISPFTDLDDTLDFKVAFPDDRLHITIDVCRKGEKYFYSAMNGVRRDITTAQLLWQTLLCPLVTAKVIFLIHWHAAILFFVKKVKHHPKEENPHLQREVSREWVKQK